MKYEVVEDMTQFKEWLFPSLFDRLTDNEPRKQKETRQDRVFDLARYRQAVLRDVLALLNTGNLQSETIAGILPENVRASVLNYGVIPFSGVNFSDIEWYLVEQSIHDALTCFEPRLDAQTLQVNAHVQDESEAMHNKLVIEIKGNLKLNPYPQEFLLRTRMDIETGTFDWADNVYLYK